MMQAVRVRLRVLLGLGIFLIIISLMLLVSRTTDQEECHGHAQSAQILQSLCLDYKNGVLAGSLCASLCNPTSFIVEPCSGYGSSGLHPAAVVGRLNQRKIFLKSEFPDRESFDSILMGTDAYDSLPSQSQFTEIVRDTIKLELNITERDAKLVDKWWGMSFNDYMGSWQRQYSSMQSVWSLIQQPQYVMTRFLRTSPYAATLHGTCGHYYAVDYIPRDSRYMANATTAPYPREDIITASWQQRVMLAMKLLEFVRVMDEDFHEPLHVCDMRGDNLMVSLKDGVKLVSLDAMMFENKFNYLAAHRDCQTDSDCNLLDCEASCDQVEEQCMAGRTNTNLQVLCRRVLLDHQYNRYHGLLNDMPQQLAVPLRSLLLRCGALSQRFASHEKLTSYEINREIYDLLAKHLYAEFSLVQIPQGSVSAIRVARH